MVDNCSRRLSIYQGPEILAESLGNTQNHMAYAYRSMAAAAPMAPTMRPDLALNATAPLVAAADVALVVPAVVLVAAEVTLTEVKDVAVEDLVEDVLLW